MISKSAVSEITDRLWEDYQAFIAGEDLSEVEVEYLFVDAVFESLRRHGAKEALLVGWAIAAGGRTASTCCAWPSATRVRRLFDRLLPVPAQPGAAAADHHHLRRAPRAWSIPFRCVSRPASGSAVGFTGWRTSESGSLMRLRLR